MTTPVNGTPTTQSQDAVADSVATPVLQLPEAIQEIARPELWNVQNLQVVGVVALRIVLILFLAYVLGRLVDRLVSRWTRRYEDLPVLAPTRQRALTISNLVASTSRYVVWPVAIIMVLSELRVDVAALIATAGIAGLAIGFGAQTLVKDVISGVFLLFDNTLAIGDRVSIGSSYGIVEDIGVRLIKVRKFDGELLMVPAGELRVFGNTSVGFMRAVVDVGFAYKEDVAKVMEILNKIARDWMDANPDVLKADDPDVLAIVGFADSAITAKIVVTVTPGEQFRAEREMRVAVKEAFDAAGIEIPFPQRTLHLPPGVLKN